MIGIDSSSLILLAKISLLDKVIKHSSKKLVVPYRVYEETVVRKSTFDAKLIEKRVSERAIIKKEVKDLNFCKKMKEDFNLGEGEAESIGLCIENALDIIVDDRKAINACKIFHVNTATVANIVIDFCKKEIISRMEAKAYIEKLEEYGRYSKEIIQQAKEDLEYEKDE